MEIELPPAGTRGVEVPAFIRPILKAFIGVGNVMFRRGWKVQGRPFFVSPPSERDEAWHEVIALAPGYGQYTTKTDRELPIFKLSPRQT